MKQDIKRMKEIERESRHTPVIIPRVRLNHRGTRGCSSLSPLLLRLSLSSLTHTRALAHSRGPPCALTLPHALAACLVLHSLCRCSYPHTYSFLLSWSEKRRESQGESRWRARRRLRLRVWCRAERRPPARRSVSTCNRRSASAMSHSPSSFARRSPTTRRRTRARPPPPSRTSSTLRSTRASRRR